MSSVVEFVPSPLFITENTIAKVRELVEEEGNPDLKLRVFVTGGGCSGFQYGFSFDETVEEDDTPIEVDGITVVLDAMSYPYLVGSTVDYESGLQGSRFVVNNPQATATCGCGASFSI
ncbi:MAG: iron-sulfur cluster insertion protein ErpA [Gammaproteobacteria bacterium]|jgi:iron-sulfur cluster insertion protein|nr:iron-sulfur cluster insertion protein ErpA [Gammaproteobacteria bacterium]